MFNHLAGRLDPAKSSLYHSTMPVTGVDYLPGRSQVAGDCRHSLNLASQYADYSVLRIGDGAKPG